MKSVAVIPRSFSYFECSSGGLGERMDVRDFRYQSLVPRRASKSSL